MLLYAILIYAAVWSVSLWWALDCVNKTSRQNEALLDAIMALSNPDDRIRLLDVFSPRDLYDRHFWHVFTFRDPWSIYPDELANLMRVAA